MLDVCLLQEAQHVLYEREDTKRGTKRESATNSLLQIHASSFIPSFFKVWSVPLNCRYPWHQDCMQASSMIQVEDYEVDLAHCNLEFGDKICNTPEDSDACLQASGVSAYANITYVLCLPPFWGTY